MPALTQASASTVNADGSIDLYFGPSLPPGEDRNWIQTIERQGWYAMLRLDDPLPSFFDHSWRPGDFEERT